MDAQKLPFFVPPLLFPIDCLDHVDLLRDLLDEQGDVKFYLPFDDFQSPPKFKDQDDYLVCKGRVESFINSRSRRIEEYAASLKTEQSEGANRVPR